MENASKALIIAGAILLSILIIGLGMFIYNQAAGAMTGANLDPQKVAAYNSEFEQYEGTISGTQARALYNAIRTHNKANVDDVSLQIALTIDGADLDQNKTYAALTKPAQMASNTLKAGKTYYVTFGYDGSSGYITCCNMKDTSSSNTSSSGT